MTRKMTFIKQTRSRINRLLSFSRAGKSYCMGRYLEQQNIGALLFEEILTAGRY